MPMFDSNTVMVDSGTVLAHATSAHKRTAAHKSTGARARCRVRAGCVVPGASKVGAECQSAGRRVMPSASGGY